MTFTEFARHILRMECGESLELYAVVNRQTRECSRPLSVRKEQWNGTPFYLLGGHGQEVRTINFAGRPKEELSLTRGTSEIAYRHGLDVAMIPGDERNFKITTRSDLERFCTIVEGETK